MDILEYISDLVSDQPIDLDGLDQFFLTSILGGYDSTYRLFIMLKEDDRMPIAYKNVLRRVHRLHNAKLIEEIKVDGGFKHGARKYRLTSRGLVYVISELTIVFNLYEDINRYLDNSILRTFLYPYFERNTLRNSTYSLSRLIDNYLIECCQKIRFHLRDEVLYTNSSLHSTSVYVLISQLKWLVRSYLIKIATMKHELVDWDLELDKKFNCVANDRHQTFELLSKDKKFMKALKESASDFSEGYDTLIKLEKTG